MEVQSLCNERQEHDGCDIHCSKGYEVATSTRIHQHPVISDHVPQARLELRWSRPTRPKFNPLVKSFDASIAANGIVSLYSHCQVV